jgi:hypothetical protein
MSQAFEICYWWENLSKPGYCVEMVDATRVFISLNYFFSIYEEEFVIHVQEYDACFDLRPDLSTIFEDIPVVLKQLTTDTKSPVEFDFFEQGTAVGMLMERQGDKITIRFEITPGSGEKFQFLPDTGIPVTSDEFIGQWLQFVRFVLDALVDLQPDIVNDESYQEYRTRLDIIKSSK